MLVGYTNTLIVTYYIFKLVYIYVIKWIFLLLQTHIMKLNNNVANKFFHFVIYIANNRWLF